MVSGVDRGTALRDYHKPSPAEQAPLLMTGFIPKKWCFGFKNIMPISSN